MASKKSTKATATTTFPVKLPGGLVLDKAMLTPDLARDWCEKYGIKKSTTAMATVKAMVDDMADGNWFDQAAVFDPIGFGKGKDPALLNGRKRILAVAEGGIPIPVYTVTGAATKVCRFINGSVRTNLPTFLKQDGKFRHVSIVSVIAYFATRVGRNGYSIERSLHGNRGTHASRYGAYSCACANRDRFCAYADLACDMAKSTDDKAANSHARFQWLVDEYGTNAHKAALVDFCKLFAHDPKSDPFVDSAVKAIRARIARLHRYEPLDAEWTIGVLLKALTGFVNARGGASIKPSKPDDVAATLADWQARVDMSRPVTVKA